MAELLPAGGDRLHATSNRRRSSAQARLNPVHKRLTLAIEAAP
jgi:hypothetical protein